ncbi:hypothetical protein LP419_27345 [Massilia sp. H-1]|nr:hypothetical protein LP419_27345 [Massilia sp. H-1]
MLVSDLSTHDFAADTEHLTAAIEGGAALRFVRQYAATVLLGVLFA